MASTTVVIDMPVERTIQQHPNTSSNDSIPLRNRSNQNQVTFGDFEEDTGAAVDVLQRWNYPRINIYRLAAIFFAFLNFGMNDGSYGALVPYIEADYDLSYTVTSLVFLSPFAGYTVAALFSDRLHLFFGRRGIALLAPSCKVVAYVVIATHPPYPAVVAILALAGLGNGLVDAAWNAWIGGLAQTNQLLGLLHGLYGLGATISPLISTSMITKASLGWWTFFYLMAALCLLEVVIGSAAFWSETGTKYTDVNRANGEEKGMTRQALKQKVTWICAGFLLCYVGLEVSLGGWIVNFMIRVRHGEPFSSGMTATGFWLGITVGRVILGFITAKTGERIAVSVYLLIAVGCELIFWLVPQFIVSAVAVSLLGFFIGPIFPSTVIAVTKLLPSDMHVAAIGFSAAIGGGGAALLPFAVGAIAQAKGPATLQPIVLALLALLIGVWLTLPRMPKHVHRS
ncbi:MAG: hypothetical protein LQ341_000609 [Variospora aurantia]|nr:MAG: hypothetical protein LQ341_000609 [Variospora aurantia]